MARSTVVCVIVFLGGLSDVLGLAQYQTRIPNGHKIPHPCKPNYLWHGVGHNNPLGGGNRNNFGLDFAAAGHKWTYDLCMKDSDNDGDTNGQELGDPDCEWQENELPAQATNISHPAVCTPWESAKCEGQNDWVTCSTGEFECEHIHTPDVRNITINFPPTKVPAKETTYMCMLFELPQDQDYHLIAHKPFIDNANVMHHIIMTGCDFDGNLPSEPFECGMNSGMSCPAALGGWTVGSPGDCLNPNFGMQFGNSTYKRVSLQFHWNNPERFDNWVDSSGVTLYYTNKLRPNNGGVLTLGQMGLKIPPRTTETIERAECPAECLQKLLKGPIQVTSGINHMHYLGRSGFVDHFRGGEKIGYLTNEPKFNYDNPQYLHFDPPLTIDKNDSFVTTCHFNSAYQKKWVYYGDGTQDEMCFGFGWFYPIENMPRATCVSWRSVLMCGNSEIVHAGCNVNSFLYQRDNASKNVFEDLEKNCKLITHCSPECREAIARAKQHPCLRGGDITDFLMERTMQHHVYTAQYLLKLRACNAEVNEDEGKCTSAASGHAVSFILIVAASFWRFL